MLIQVPKLARMPVRYIYISIKVMASAFHQLLWQVSLNKNRYEEVRILTWPCRVNSDSRDKKRKAECCGTGRILGSCEIRCFIQPNLLHRNLAVISGR